MAGVCGADRRHASPRGNIIYKNSLELSLRALVSQKSLTGDSTERETLRVLQVITLSHRILNRSMSSHGFLSWIRVASSILRRGRL